MFNAYGHAYCINGGMVYPNFNVHNIPDHAHCMLQGSIIPGFFWELSTVPSSLCNALHVAIEKIDSRIATLASGVHVGV